MSSQNRADGDNVLNFDDDLIGEELDLVITKTRDGVLSDDEETVVENVVLTLEKLLRHIHVLNVEEVILKDVCGAACDIFNNTINGIERINDMSVLSQTQMNRTEACLHLLDLCSVILVAFWHSAQYFLTLDGIVYNCLENYLRTVDCLSKNGADHYKKRARFYSERNSAIDEFGIKVNNLQSQYYALLATKIQFSVDEDSEVIQTYCESFAVIAVESIDLNVAFMINTWKMFLTFIDKCKDVVPRTTVVHILSKLSDKISSDLDVIWAGKRAVKEVTNTFKVDNFLLKMIEKICRIFQGNLGGNLDSLFNLMFILFRNTPTFLRSSGKTQDETSEITKYLSVGANPLLAALYTGSEFSTQLEKHLEANSKKNPYGCLMLLLSLWKKLLTARLREQFFGANLNILQWIFDTLDECHWHIVAGKYFAMGSVVQESRPDLYEFVFTSLAGPILTFSGEEFLLVEDTLLRNILQPYPWKAILACDLWILIARCGDCQLCHATVEALIPLLEHVDLSTSRPEFIYLSSFLRRLIPLTDSRFLLKFSAKYPPQSNMKIWAVIGLQHYKPESQIPVAVEPCLLTIREWLKNEAPRLELHNRMQYTLTAIAAIPMELDELDKLWSRYPVGQNNRLSDYFSGVLSTLTSASIDLIPEDNLIEILQIFGMILRKASSLPQQLSILRVLNKISNTSWTSKRFLDLVAAAFKELLDSSSVIIRNIALQYFTELSYNHRFTDYIGRSAAKDAKLKIVFSNYLRKILPNNVPELSTKKILFVHQCCENFPEENSSRKRLKLEKNLSVDNALERLQHDITVISDNWNDLNDSQKTVARNLYTSLAQIMK